jgi:hypothetical protein
VRLVVRADQLPMTLVDLSADVEVPIERRAVSRPKRKAS